MITKPVKPKNREPGVFSYSHTDMDGKAASYFVHKLLDKLGIPNDVGNFVNVDYDYQKIDHTADDLVFITDLSFTERTFDDLKQICRTAKHVIWIDHHDSSAKLMDKHYDELAGISNLSCLVDTHACGAFLTYAVYNLFNSKEEFDKFLEYPEHTFIFKIKEPAIFLFEAEAYAGYSLSEYINISLSWHDMIGPNHPIRLIDDHDRWTKRNEEATTAFNLGVSIEQTSLTIYKGVLGKYVFNPFWGRLFDGGAGGERTVKKYITAGATIRSYLGNRYAGELRFNGGEVYLAGYGTYQIVNNRGNSWCFGDDFQRYDGSFLWSFNEQTQRYIYSLYVPDNAQDALPANLFCEMFGGGGHKGAAGFQSNYQLIRAGQGGLGAKREDLENIIVRVWTAESLELVDKIAEIYNQNSNMCSADVLHPELYFKTPCTDLYIDANNDEYVEVAIVRPENVQTIMEWFAQAPAYCVNNPFLIILPTFDKSRDNLIDLADFAANAIEDIINDFLID